MLDRTIILTAFTWMRKAEHDYNAAQHNLKNGFYNVAIDRAFFCMYHAARALLVYEFITPTQTSVIIHELHERYIRKKHHDPNLKKMMEFAKDYRLRGIYNEYIASKQEAKQHVKNAEYFLETAKTLTARRLELEYDAEDYKANPPSPEMMKAVAKIVQEQ